MYPQYGIKTGLVPKYKNKLFGRSFYLETVLKYINYFFMFLFEHYFVKILNDNLAILKKFASSCPKITYKNSNHTFQNSLLNSILFNNSPDPGAT